MALKYRLRVPAEHEKEGGSNAILIICGALYRGEQLVSPQKTITLGTRRSSAPRLRDSPPRQSPTPSTAPKTGLTVPSRGKEPSNRAGKMLSDGPAPRRGVWREWVTPCRPGESYPKFPPVQPQTQRRGQPHSSPDSSPSTSPWPQRPALGRTSGTLTPTQRAFRSRGLGAKSWGNFSAVSPLPFPAARPAFATATSRSLLSLPMDYSGFRFRNTFPNKQVNILCLAFKLKQHRPDAVGFSE